MTVEHGVSQAVGERPGSKRSPALRVYLSLIPTIVIGGLVAAAIVDDQVPDQLVAGAGWIAALFVAEMFPVQIWRDIQVTLGFPMLMFLAVLYPPGAVGIFALIGSGDPREFTGRSDLLRSLFNRSQVAAAGFAASSIFHLLASDPHVGPRALGAATAAGITQVVVNMLLVGWAARIDYGIPLRRVLQKMPVGNRWLFQAAYVVVGVFGAVMALVYLEVGIWAVAGLVPPLIALRHLIKVSATLARTEAEMKREVALQKVAEELAAERHEERERLASILHDEISPLISSVSMTAETAAKRMNGDAAIVEPLRHAAVTAREAQRQVRTLIGELLQSPHGPEGLGEALRVLVTEVESEHGISVHHDVETVRAPGAVNEVLFGAAREATRNAVRHGHPSVLDITLREGDGSAILTIADDGTGFDPAAIHGESAYGLRLLRQRVETCGGRVSVISSPGRGTIVTVEVPLALKES